MIALAVILAIACASSIGALIWMAHVATDAVEATSDARATLAHVQSDLAITKASLDTTERLRKAQAERSRALEAELAAVQDQPIVSPDLHARDRVLARWRDAEAVAAGDRGPVALSDATATSAPIGDHVLRPGG